MIATLRLLAALAMAGTCLAATDTAAAERRETRPVSGFVAIGLAVPAKLEVIQGETEGMAIEGEESALANVETVVEDGTLKIRAKSRVNFAWNSKLRITVNAKRIESLAISGAGDIQAQTLRSPSLKVTISGSGDVRIATLDTERLEVAIHGSGDVRLAGKAAEVSSRIAGSGDLKAERLEARQVKISIAGSGDAAVWARESLAVKIAGSGDVRYYGDPTIDKTIMGSGSVKRLGPAPS